MAKKVKRIKPCGMISAFLEVTVKDKNGKVVKVKKVKDDMFLKQFADIFLFGVLGHSNLALADTTVQSKDESGTTRTLRIYDSVFAGFTFGVEGLHRKISIGTGTTDPARTDYTLETYYAHTENVDVVQTADYVQFVAAITCAAETVITEVGFSNWFYDFDGDMWWFMLLRDVLDAITVPEGGTYNVIYRINI